MDRIKLQEYYPSELEIKKIENSTDRVEIFMKTTTQKVICPKCGKTADKKGGIHNKTVYDLPILGKQVKLNIKYRNFVCMNEDCEKKYISETIPGFVEKFNHRTQRLNDFILRIALATSAEESSRILKTTGIEMSGQSVINLILKRFSETETGKCSTSIGIDDFANKKGKKYCTVIVDETTHKPIDVFEGRECETVKKWLAENKHIRSVTRDRSGAYSAALQEMLPDCIQIADRFHLYKNLTDTITSVINASLPARITEDIYSDNDSENIKKIQK